MDNVISRIVDITPEWALRLLETNYDNRTLSSKLVRQYADDMKAGRWPLNGESIKVDDRGNVVDGQHRLWAILESGITLRTVLVEGVANDSRRTVDMGRPRTASSILQMEGLASSTNVAAAAGAALRYQHYPEKVWSSSNIVSKVEIVDFARLHHEALNNGVIRARDLDSIKPVVSAYAAFHFEAVTLGFDEPLSRFHHQVSTGANLDEGDPALTYRDWVLTRRKGLREWQQQQFFAITVKAFNYHLKDRGIKRLRFEKEMLPMPKIGG